MVIALCRTSYGQITDQPAANIPPASSSSSANTQQNIGSYQAQQPIPAVVPNTPSDPGGTPSAPIDGGISILIAAGVGYGVKKVKERRKKKLEEMDKG